MSKYGGESPQKTIARQLYWEKVTKTIGKNKTHLVLCGPDAGDARLVSAIYEPQCVVAIDKNIEAIDSAEKKILKQYPIFLIHGDVANCVDEFCHNEKFDSIFLDWCSCICSSMLTKTFKIAKKYLKKDGCLGVGFLAARESVFFTSQLGKRRGNSSDSARIQLFKNLAEKAGYQMIWCCSYFGTSPMIYILLRKIGVEKDSKEVEYKKINISRKDIELEVKYLMNSGKLSSRTIEDIYCLPPFTVAGWKAAQTKRNRLNKSI